MMEDDEYGVTPTTQQQQQHSTPTDDLFLQQEQNNDTAAHISLYQEFNTVILLAIGCGLVLFNAIAL
jgi:hypothetical protein